MDKGFLFLLFLPSFLLCQSGDSLIQRNLNEVLLIDFRSKNMFPWTHKKDTAALVDRFQTSLRTLFDRQPGMQSFNGENFAQDIRISIRGYGNRSAFGIRGLRIYQDGIPLTSPDGTSQLDELSIYDVQEMEVLRSGLAARFGNAGGAIALKSAAFTKGLSFISRLNAFGAFDAGIKFGSSKGRVQNILSVNHHTFHGKRDYSKAQNNTVYNKTRFLISDHWQLDLISSLYYSPYGEDPGALNYNEFMSTRYKANERNRQFKAGETVGGLLTAIKSVVALSDNTTFRSTLFYRKRIFTGRLPFENGGWIDLNRDFFGCSNTLEYQGNKNNRVTLGQHVEFQDDLRKLYKNTNGIKSGNTADQNERVTNLALYEQWQLNYSRLSLHQLLRYDHYVYSLTDRFLADGTQSGNKNYNRLNGALGLGYQWFSALFCFANISTTFELPALNELTNNPSGTGGFNLALRPESSVQSELGIKIKKNNNIEFDVVWFYVAISDQIQGYELAASPGKTYYRNAPSGKRFGMELTARWKPAEQVTTFLNYTYSNFKYSSFLVGTSSFSGNTQPLIPIHKLNLNFIWNMNHWAEFQLLAGFTDKMYLDDANLNNTRPYGEINLVWTTGPKLFRKYTLGFQANNVLNLMPYSNFRINAAGQRFYEAASPAHFGVFFKANLI